MLSPQQSGLESLPSAGQHNLHLGRSQPRGDSCVVSAVIKTPRVPRRPSRLLLPLLLVPRPPAPPLTPRRRQGARSPSVLLLAASFFRNTEAAPLQPARGSSACGDGNCSSD